MSLTPFLPQNPDRLTACQECDLLHRLPELADGTLALCQRCGAFLAQKKTGHIERTLALTLTSLILFAIVNAFPLMSLRLGGRETSMTLVAGALELKNHGMWDVVILVFLTSLLFPLLHYLMLLYVLIPLTMNHAPPGAARCFRISGLFSPWGMIGVYMLGVLVAIVKLSDMATVVPGTALYALVGLLFFSTAADHSLDTTDVWRQIESCRK